MRPVSELERATTHRYYPLEISYFKSTTDSALLDLLWNKYWVNTLSSNPLLSVRAPFFESRSIDREHALHHSGCRIVAGGRAGGWRAQNRDYVAQQVDDVARKLEQMESSSLTSARFSSVFPGSDSKRKERSALGKTTRDCCKLSQDVLHGLLSQTVKAATFQGPTQP